MKLTNDQTLALEKLSEFLDGDKHVFMLKGYAGTGKTTLLKGIVDYLQTNNRTVCAMAPTGRASLVVQQKTGVKNAQTIHKHIYNMEKFEDKESAESEGLHKTYYKLSENQNPSNTIYIVDEASMISDLYSDDDFFIYGSGYLLKDLIEFTSVKSRVKSKIIFVGDEAQLPPVFMNSSPALNKEYLLEKYNLVSEEIILREVIRQAGSSLILKNATQIREAIEANTFNSFRIDFQENNVEKLDEKLLEERFVLNYKQTPKETILVTHSNSQALYYNQLLRILIYNNQQNLNQNEQLLVVRNYYGYSTELFNGMIVNLLEWESIPEHKSVKFIAEKGKKVTVNFTFRNVTIEVIDINKISTQIQCLIIENLLNEPAPSLTAMQKRGLFIDFKNRMSEQGIKRGEDTYKQHLKTDKYLNAVQCKYGYAITCHKAQGGEWDNTFIDFNVIMGKNNLNFYRWAYTAVTRSKKYLGVLNNFEFDPLSKFEVKEIGRINGGQQNYYYPIIGGLSFTDWRRNKIEELVKEQNISVEQNLGIAYQHLIKFIKDTEECNLRLWYNKDFYTGKIDVISSSSVEFSVSCASICEESLITKEIPFNAKFQFQNLLHNFIYELTSALEIGVINIVQKAWSDIYYFKTNAACSYIEFHFNSKGIYTAVMPKSSDGNDDIILNSIIENLKNN